MHLKPIIYILITLPLIISISTYHNLPDKMATHWNSSGEVDGYSSRFFGAFLIPILTIGITLLFIILPSIDPLKKNYKKFEKQYEGFIFIFIIFMLIIHIQMILWNMDILISPMVIIPVGLGFLFIYTGILLKNAKRNWFVGIRTPWTLSNENVWNKTHKRAGPLFQIAGLIAILGILLPKVSFYLMVIPVLLIVFYTIFYSYQEFKKEKTPNQKL